MKNIKPFSLTNKDLQEIESGIFTDSNQFFIGLCFEQEPELGEGSSSADISQYPLEDILDLFSVSVSDFCEASNSQKKKQCKLVFASRSIDNIRELKSIIGKHVYNKVVKSGGEEVVDLLIE